MKKTCIILITILSILIIFSFSTPFCNFYADNIYGYLNLVTGTITGFIPFALGEIIMYLGAILLLLLPILYIVRLFCKAKKYRRFLRKYTYGIIVTLLVFLIVYCVNWLIPFRCDALRVTEDTNNTFTDEELVYVRNLIVNRINELSYEIERDETGHLIYDYSEEDIFEAMRKSSSDYPRLTGHYSPAKTALCSDFLEWMGIGGYNYVYTMEPTINRYLYPLYRPVLYAHELSHHKGYYKENEAEFLSFVTLSESENTFLQYCAYIDVYYWINREFTKNYDENQELFTSSPKLNELVRFDINNSNTEGEAYYEANVNKWLEERFSETSDEIASEGWEIQGEILKTNTYSGVTLMVLQYYLRR